MKIASSIKNKAINKLRKPLVISASIIASILLVGCDKIPSSETPFRIIESFDNRAIATDIDAADSSVVTTGISIGDQITLGTTTDVDQLDPEDGQSIFVVKHNREGLQLWEREIRADKWNSVAHMKIDQADGSIVLVGHTGPMPSTDQDIQSLDMFDNAIAKDEEITPLGTRPSLPFGAAKLLRSWLIVKLDSQGNEVFRRTWRECLPDTYDWNSNQFLCTTEAKFVAIGGTGNIYVAGTAGSPWPMEKVHIAAFDSVGNVLWDDLRTDLHVGPIAAPNLAGDSVGETAMLNDPEQYKVINYDTGRLMHYAWNLVVTSSGGGDTIHAVMPTENIQLRGVLQLNQEGDLIGSRRLHSSDLVATINPLPDGRIFLGGQVENPGQNDHARANLTLVDADLNALSTYSYPLFSGVTFDILMDDSSSVFAAANVTGIANKDVILFKLNGVDTNSLAIDWDNLYSTTPSLVLNAYSIDNGKRLLRDISGSLALVGDAYKTPGQIVIDLPDEDFVEPIIEGSFNANAFGFLPLVGANFNINLNIPDMLHIGITEADSIRFKALFNPATGLLIKSETKLGEELSTPYLIAQHESGALVQVTRSWNYNDNKLRSIYVTQDEGPKPAE